MLANTALNGAPCDTDHPFPVPAIGRYIDSMDYGDDERGLVDGKPTMYDHDTTPTWRLIAAWTWDTDCRHQHVTEVAQDPILTAHLIASAVLAHDPAKTDPVTRLGFAESGAGAVFTALHDGGLEGGRRQVDAMHVRDRERAITECVAHILHGLTALTLDTGATFDRPRG